MNKYESLGVSAIVTKDKLKIEIPIKNLVNGFNLYPENYDESTIKRGMRQEFANYVAKQLVDGSDPDTGDNPIMTMLDSIFDEILESAEDFVKSGEDDDY